jgi:hypothetical protein
MVEADAVSRRLGPPAGTSGLGDLSEVEERPQA